MRATLERNYSTLDRVMKCDVLLVDMADYEKMSAAYSKQFLHSRPARITYVVAGLPLGARVEMNCIAAATKKR
ncbi:MAG: RidA family protein [Candidatus Protistobacter heckmanni]|nr:RidA family protein [Candidatus Protistobacter heckmanni]